ncbi:hypothetical protein L2E82_22858 [Cichorium intybus]|uniref:Uncharacterized protein n=1 Tax=Cichorium intybus TaxID=13427 RepID=A0ACB9DZX2_CICIN|nr:hypothetical protein L2E82_22858 [Cichorium intybus]
MSEESTKQKKGTISEEDVSIILQRYTATTVLALLQEVAQVEESKIDWNAMVKRTMTGITNPREYQMLWRHLAYRDSMVENLEDESKPLDDESDLEYELEVSPSVNNESSMEAAACVKVLIASGSTSDSGLEKGLTIEAPLTINIPNGKLSSDLSETSQGGSTMRGTNITVPVSVQKQPVAVVGSTEGVETNGSGSGNLPPRRKRKPWSAAEDMELFAAVQKCGEGNWANILKGDFKGDRTASQLSQRWNIIKKRKENSTVRSGSQLSEVHLAARRAINMALDQPGDNLKTSSSLGRTKSSITANSSIRPILPDTPSTSARADSSLTVTTKPFPKTPPKSLANSPDPVKAAAVAAGARIATQSAAAAIIKQQLKSAIHIKNVTGASFRDLHSPNPRPLNPGSSSTARETTNGVAVSSSPKTAPEDQGESSSRVCAENGNLAKVEGLVLKNDSSENVQDTSEKEVKENEPVPVVMETCKNESAKQDN